MKFENLAGGFCYGVVRSDRQFAPSPMALAPWRLGEFAQLHPGAATCVGAGGFDACANSPSCSLRSGLGALASFGRCWAWPAYGRRLAHFAAYGQSAPSVPSIACTALSRLSPLNFLWSFLQFILTVKSYNILSCFCQGISCFFADALKCCLLIC